MIRELVSLLRFDKDLSPDGKIHMSKLEIERLLKYAMIRLKAVVLAESS